MNGISGLLLYLFIYYIIILQFYSEIKNIYLAAHRLLFLGSLFGVGNCTAERKQNGERYPGRMWLAEAVPSCWTYAGAGGFLIAGQLRPVNAPQSGRNGPNLGLTRKQVECTVKAENPSEGP